MKSPNVWVVGDRSFTEFQRALAVLDERAQVHFVQSSATGGARSLLDGAPSGEPYVVVFLTPRPDSVSRLEAEDWQRRFPLARFLVLLGSWCEGELRSGRPWPGATRLLWHAAEARLAADESPSTGLEKVLHLPRTASDVERFDAILRPQQRAGDQRSDGLIMVRAARTATAECLIDACGWAGFRAERCLAGRDLEPTRAVAEVWDCERTLDLSCRLKSVADDETQRVPVLALMNFPRFEDDQAARQLGVRVLAKPFRLDDFGSLLRQLVAAGRVSFL